MIYVNDCSIRVVRPCIKISVQEIFVQVFAYENYFTTKKANYSMKLVTTARKIMIKKVAHNAYSI